MFEGDDNSGRKSPSSERWPSERITRSLFPPIQSSDEAEEQQTKAEGKQADWLCH